MLRPQGFALLRALVGVVLEQNTANVLIRIMESNAPRAVATFATLPVRRNYAAALRTLCELWTQRGGPIPLITRRWRRDAVVDSFRARLHPSGGSSGRAGGSSGTTDVWMAGSDGRGEAAESMQEMLVSACWVKE
jgi:hypothetical protein